MNVIDYEGTHRVSLLEPGDGLGLLLCQRLPVRLCDQVGLLGVDELYGSGCRMKKRHRGEGIKTAAVAIDELYNSGCRTNKTRR